MTDWVREKLGHLVSLEYGSALGAESRSGSGFCVYGSNGVIGYHHRSLVTGPGIIVGRKGSMGALQWSEYDFWPIDTTYYVNSKIDLDLRWLYEVLRISGLDLLNSSTGVPGLNREEAYECPVSVPPLEEQRRIAEIFDTIDEAIQTTQRTISKRKALRSGLAADLLAGHTDITVLTNSDLSEASRSHQSPRSIQNGYRSKRLPYLLSDVASSTVDGPFGSALKTEHYVQGYGVRVVRLANLGDGQFVDNDQVFVEKSYADALSRHEVRGGDVLVAALGDDNHRPGRACLYPIELEPGIVKADCFRIRSSNLIDSRYLREALNSKDVVHQVSQLAQGVTRDRINLSQLRRIVLQIPPIREQQWIADFLDTIDETIQSDEGKLVKLQQLRAGLANDLLSGRVRTVAA